MEWVFTRWTMKLETTLPHSLQQLHPDRILTMTHFLHVDTQNQWEVLDILVLFHGFLNEVRLINIQRSNRHIPTLILHRSIYLPSMSANHQELILDLPKIEQFSTTIHDLPTTIRSLIYQQQIQTQPENLVQSQPQQQQNPARPTLVQQQQKPLHVLVNDMLRLSSHAV